jgi:phosphoglycolate phosphatase
MDQAIRAVAFDLDGTLIDSYRDIAGALNEVLAGLGRPTHDPEEVKTMIGGGVDTLLRRGLGEDAPLLVRAARERFRAAYQARLLETTALYDDVLDAIASLARDGVLSVIATNKPSFFTRTIVDRLGLARAGVRAFASADEVDRRKPDPAVVALALTRAAGGEILSPGEVRYVGDMPVDVETARAFGCPAIGVAWGFDPTGLAQARPDAWVESPRALFTLIEQHNRR